MDHHSRRLVILIDVSAWMIMPTIHAKGDGFGIIRLPFESGLE
ncbi:MAG: hypothetical protein VX910_06345 [Candidatus Latescibacterota bacterium]|nr:hypothetical protein [Candidatus Latescibacterota bacterium]